MFKSLKLNYLGSVFWFNQVSENDRLFSNAFIELD